MLGGCLILLVALIILGYGIVSIIPWWFVGIVIACIWIVGILSEDDDY
jgi:hypothetical protein